MGQRLFATPVKFWQGEPAIFVARIETAGGVPLVIANVTSFSVSVFNTTSNPTPEVPEYTLGSIDPAVAYFDTLQHGYDNRLGDSVGANFVYVIAADEFAFRGGNTYRVQIVSSIGSSSHVQVYAVTVGEVF